jgi:hypothetical protein
MQDMVPLICKHNKNGVQQAQEGERGEQREKAGIKEGFTGKIPDSISGNNPSDERDTQVL